MIWSRKPFIYEINTRVWLTELSRRFDRPVTLGDVPEEVFEEFTRYHFDAIWMMGVWTRNPQGRKTALKYSHEYRAVLPDLTPEDVIGSAYAIGAYEVDGAAGGRDGLAAFRDQLRRHGIRLILDYVPNHIATDHEWVRSHPEYLVRGREQDITKFPGMFFAARDADGKRYAAAYGRDPYSPSWIDTAQLNAFNPGLRAVTVETLLDIASQCDGVRCDMAMLLLNEVFNRTWGKVVREPVPEQDFWEMIIPQVKAQHPNFMFMAEAYWGLEGTLQQQGFDFTYDKTLYDRLYSADVPQTLQHLTANIASRHHCVHFIENHDEHRAAAGLGIEKSKAAAILICTLPGAVLLHDGQFSGYKVKLPVQISRKPVEETVPGLDAFYHRLLTETHHPIYQRGEWTLFPVEDDAFIAHGWHHGDDYRLVVVNLTDELVDGEVDLSAWGEGWSLHETLLDAPHDRIGEAIVNITLDAYGARVFRLDPLSAQTRMAAD
jgi:glycosidase